MFELLEAVHIAKQLFNLRSYYELSALLELKCCVQNLDIQLTVAQLKALDLRTLLCSGSLMMPYAVSPRAAKFANAAICSRHKGYKAIEPHLYRTLPVVEAFTNVLTNTLPTHIPLHS